MRASFFIISYFLLKFLFAQSFIGFNIHLLPTHKETDIRLLKSKLKLRAKLKTSLNSRKGHKFLLFELNSGAIDKQEFDLIKELLFQYSFIDYISPLEEVGNDYVSHLQEIFVKTKGLIFEDTLISWGKRFNISYEGKYDGLSDTYIFCINKFSNKPLQDICDGLKLHKNVKWVNKNSLFSVNISSEPDDQYYYRQWGINNTGSIPQFSGIPGADMDVERAWETTTGDPNIKIAILDSGVDTLHPDLINNLLSGYDALEQGTKGYPRSETDTISYTNDGHGTSCSGIVGAESNNSIGISGVAFSCKIIPIRVFIYIDLGGDKIGFTSNLWASNALNWAYSESDADVLSNSYGLPEYLISASGIDTTLINSILSNAVYSGRNGLGLPALFSAGNEDDSVVIWPASHPSTIAVSASTMCDELKTIDDCSNESWSSNYGTGLDIAAPGVKIPTTDMTGNKGYNSTEYFLTFNGTSAACPNAAAVVGLILSVNNEFKLDEVKNLLFTTAEKTGNYEYSTLAQYGLWSKEFGYGRVNAYEAVQKAILFNDSINSITDSIFLYHDGIGNTYLGISCLEDKALTYEIYNLMGQSVLFINKEMISAGRHYLSLNDIKFPKGVYIVKVDLDQKSITRPVLF